MPKIIKEFAKRHLSTSTDSFSVQKLTGGISSEIYKIEVLSTQGEALQQLALTILRAPETWWKMEKERIIREVIGNDPEVLIPELIDIGFDEIEGRKVAFLLADFIAGKDVDTFLERHLVNGTNVQQLQKFADDLGYRTGAIHRHNIAMFGLLGLQLDQQTNWEVYITNQIDQEIKGIYLLNKDLSIGSVSVREIQALLPQMQVFLGALQSSLETDTPSLTHGDARFGNIIANQAQNNDWRVASFIDLEAMLGADPELDISFMENWLHFSSYKNIFFGQRSSFAEGYSRHKSVSPQYHKKRFIYHALRSMSYLRTVFNFDIRSFISSNSKHTTYVAQHFQILQSLARGNYLEDIGIEALI